MATRFRADSGFNSRLREEATCHGVGTGEAGGVSTHASVRRRPG